MRTSVHRVLVERGLRKRRRHVRDGDSGADLPDNREGSNNCYFYGIGGGVAAGNHAHSSEPYGLPTPLDDDTPNGYCSRNDGFNGLDKSVSCESATDCESAGAPYASVKNLLPLENLQHQRPTRGA